MELGNYLDSLIDKTDLIVDNDKREKLVTLVLFLEKWNKKGSIQLNITKIPKIRDFSNREA